MTANNRIVLSSDHSAIALRQAIGVHIAAQGWVVIDIGPTEPQSTPYPQHGEAAARQVASGDCREDSGALPCPFRRWPLSIRRVWSGF